MTRETLLVVLPFVIALLIGVYLGRFVFSRTTCVMTKTFPWRDATVTVTSTASTPDRAQRELQRLCDTLGES